MDIIGMDTYGLIARGDGGPIGRVAGTNWPSRCGNRGQAVGGGGFPASLRAVKRH